MVSQQLGDRIQILCDCVYAKNAVPLHSENNSNGFLVLVKDK